MKILPLLILLVCTAVCAGQAQAAALTITKTAAINSDPIDLTLPKAIPGAIIDYTITVSNPNLSSVSTVVISDALNTVNLPQGVEYYVGVSNANPIVFGDINLLGISLSGLTYTWSGLNSATDSVSFSCDYGASWGCQPNADSAGYASNVTNIRVAPSGSLNGLGAISIKIRVRVKS